MTEATNAVKIQARKAVNHAIEAGRLSSRPCQKCGGTLNLQAHHHDYSKPLDVEWLCSKCHGELRRKHPITKECTVCGTTFTPHPTKRLRAKTCSPDCRAKAISKALLANPVIPPWAKLDESKAQEIRRRYREGGCTIRSLAAEYGVHHQTIGATVRHKIWRHREAVAA